MADKKGKKDMGMSFEVQLVAPPCPRAQTHQPDEVHLQLPTIQASPRTASMARSQTMDHIPAMKKKLKRKPSFDPDPESLKRRAEDLVAKLEAALARVGHVSVYWFVLCQRIRVLLDKYDLCGVEFFRALCVDRLWTALQKWQRRGRMPSRELLRLDENVYMGLFLLMKQNFHPEELARLHDRAAFVDIHAGSTSSISHRLFWFRFFGLFRASVDLNVFARALRLHLDLDCNQKCEGLPEAVFAQLVKATITRCDSPDQVSVEDFRHFVYRFGPLHNCFEKMASVACWEDTRLRRPSWFVLQPEKVVHALLKEELKTAREEHKEEEEEEETDWSSCYKGFLVHGGDTWNEDKHAFTASWMDAERNKVVSQKIIFTTVGGVRRFQLGEDTTARSPSLRELLVTLAKRQQPRDSTAAERWQALQTQLAHEAEAWSTELARRRAEAAEEKADDARIDMVYKRWCLQSFFVGFCPDEAPRPACRVEESAYNAESSRAKIRGFLEHNEPLKLQNSFAVALENFRVVDGNLLHDVVARACDTKCSNELHWQWVTCLERLLSDEGVYLDIFARNERTFTPLRLALEHALAQEPDCAAPASSEDERSFADHIAPLGYLTGIGLHHFRWLPEQALRQFWPDVRDKNELLLWHGSRGRNALRVLLVPLLAAAKDARSGLDASMPVFEVESERWKEDEELHTLFEVTVNHGALLLFTFLLHTVDEHGALDLLRCRMRGMNLLHLLANANRVAVNEPALSFTRRLELMLNHTMRQLFPQEEGRRAFFHWGEFCETKREEIMPSMRSLLAHEVVAPAFNAFMSQEAVTQICVGPLFTLLLAQSSVSLEATPLRRNSRMPAFLRHLHAPAQNATLFFRTSQGGHRFRALKPSWEGVEQPVEPTQLACGPADGSFFVVTARGALLQMMGLQDDFTKPNAQSVTLLDPKANANLFVTDVCCTRNGIVVAVAESKRGSVLLQASHITPGSNTQQPRACDAKQRRLFRAHSVETQSLKAAQNRVEQTDFDKCHKLRHFHSFFPGACTRIVQVAAGASHVLALTHEGTIWSWGGNEAGQLGRVGDLHTPTLIESLMSVLSVKVAAGGAHSMALSASTGQVYTWGANGQGQLGRPTLGKSSTAVGVVNFDSSFRAEDIAAGSAHSMALLACRPGSGCVRVVHTWGHCGNDFIGIKPRCVRQLTGRGPSQVFAGGDLAVCLCSSALPRIDTAEEDATGRESPAVFQPITAVAPLQRRPLLRRSTSVKEMHIVRKEFVVPAVKQQVKGVEKRLLKTDVLELKHALERRERFLNYAAAVPSLGNGRHTPALTAARRSNLRILQKLWEEGARLDNAASDINVLSCLLENYSFRLPYLRAMFDANNRRSVRLATADTARLFVSVDKGVSLVPDVQNATDFVLDEAVDERGNRFYAFRAFHRLLLHYGAGEHITLKEAAGRVAGSEELFLFERVDNPNVYVVQTMRQPHRTLTVHDGQLRLYTVEQARHAQGDLLSNMFLVLENERPMKYLLNTSTKLLEDLGAPPYDRLSRRRSSNPCTMRMFQRVLSGGQHFPFGSASSSALPNLAAVPQPSRVQPLSRVLALLQGEHNRRELAHVVLLLIKHGACVDTKAKEQGRVLVELLSPMMRRDPILRWRVPKYAVYNGDEVLVDELFCKDMQSKVLPYAVHPAAVSLHRSALVDRGRFRFCWSSHADSLLHLVVARMRPLRDTAIRIVDVLLNHEPDLPLRMQQLHLETATEPATDEVAVQEKERKRKTKEKEKEEKKEEKVPETSGDHLGYLEPSVRSMSPISALVAGQHAPRKPLKSSKKREQDVPRESEIFLSFKTGKKYMQPYQEEKVVEDPMKLFWKDPELQLQAMCVNVNVRDSNGMTTLHCVAAAFETGNSNKIIAEALLRKKANIMRPDGLGLVPLHYAALKNQFEVVKQLLDVRAVLDSRISPLELPASAALHSPSVLSVRSIMQATTATWNAQERNPAELSRHLRRLELLRMPSLYERPGAAQLGRTALHLAAHEGHWQIASLILQAGAASEVVDSLGETAIALAMLAWRNCFEEFVRLFVSTYKKIITHPPPSGSLHQRFSAKLHLRRCMRGEELWPLKNLSGRDMKDLKKIIHDELQSELQLRTPAGVVRTVNRSKRDYTFKKLATKLLLKLQNHKQTIDVMLRLKCVPPRRQLISELLPVAAIYQFKVEQPLAEIERRLASVRRGQPPHGMETYESLYRTTTPRSGAVMEEADKAAYTGSLGIKRTLAPVMNASHAAMRSAKASLLILKQSKRDIFEDPVHQLVIDEMYERKVTKAHRNRFVRYLLFLLFLTMMIGFETRQTFFFHRAFEQTFIQDEMSFNVSKLKRTFNDVDNVEEFWMYLRGTLLQTLYPKSSVVYWEGSEKRQRAPGYVNRQSYVLGRPRVRQIRSRTFQCNIPTKWREGLHSVCFGKDFDGADFDTESFGPNLTYTWSSEDVLNGAPFWGIKDTYPGSGFVLDLPDPTSENAAEEALRLVEDLEANDWIDGKTRAVFIEFTLFNANKMFFGVAQIVAEFPSEGGVVTFSQYAVNKLKRYFLNEVDEGVFVMELFVLLCMLIHAVFSVSQCHYMRLKRRSCWAGLRSYFSNFKHVLDFLIHLFFLAIVVTRFVELAWVPTDEEFFDHSTYLKVQPLNLLLVWQRGFMAVYLLLSWLQLSNYLSISRRMSLLLLMAGLMVKEVLLFSVIMVIVLVGFAVAENVAYGFSKFESYTWYWSAFSRLSEAFSGLDFQENQVHNRVLGTAFSTLFVFLVVLLLLNLIIAMMTTAYERARQEQNVSMAERHYEQLVFEEERRKNYLHLLLVEPVDHIMTDIFEVSVYFLLGGFLRHDRKRPSSSFLKWLRDQARHARVASQGRTERVHPCGWCYANWKERKSKKRKTL